MIDIKQLIHNLDKKYKTLDPYELAEAMGIIIHRMELGNTRGFCYTSRRIKQIILNNNLPEWTERFVLAHEIGHLVMHPKHSAPFLQSTFFSMDKFEIEANKFATELIIPDDELMDMYEYTVDELSALYGLPRAIIELRFR